MITIIGNIAKFEGTPKELTFEFTHCILGFKSSLMRDFNLSGEEANKVILKCQEISCMNKEEALNFINELEGGK